jgi:hypothetical protein
MPPSVVHRPLALLPVLALLLAGGCRQPNPEFVGSDATGPSPDVRAGDGALPTDGLPRDAAGMDLAGMEAASGDGVDPVIDLRAGLVAYWGCDQDPGDGQLDDDSGNGNAGALTGLDSAVAWVAGRQGNALEIPDVQGAGVVVPASGAIDQIRSFTLAAWVYRIRDVAGRHTAVISRQYASASREIYNLAFDNYGKLALYLYSPPGAAVVVVTAPSAAPLGAWVHVAATYDGKVARLYQGGTQTRSLDYVTVLPGSPNPLVVGNNENGGILTQPLVGRLDAVVLYDRALSAGQIAALAAGRTP